jgi:hypothetical protein
MKAQRIHGAVALVRAADVELFFNNAAGEMSDCHSHPNRRIPCVQYA